MKRILITDDNEKNRYLLQVLLEANGFEVMTAVNGAEALDLARRHRPDLIITDILMPVMDGFALCRHWKSDPGLQSIPFLFYTATFTHPKDQDSALGLGADGFLIKPQEPEVLLRMLEELLEKRQPAPTTLPPSPGPNEEKSLKQYNHTLVRQLEQNLVELEETRRTLEQDIEDRQQAERTLRESEDRKSQIIENAPAAIVTINEAGQIIDWNWQAEVMFGWKRHEAHWRQMSELIIPPRFRQAHEEGMKHALARGLPQSTPRRMTIVAQDKDGREFPAELSMAWFQCGDSWILSAFLWEHPNAEL